MRGLLRARARTTPTSRTRSTSRRRGERAPRGPRRLRRRLPGPGGRPTAGGIRRLPDRGGGLPLPRLTAPFVDGSLRLPPIADRRGFAHALASACRDEAVRLVLPSTDHELTALAALRPALAASGTTVAVCDPRSSPGFATRRRSTRAWAPPACRCSPPSPSPTGPAGPLIGKPRHGWGGRGVVIVRGPADLEALPRARAERARLAAVPGRGGRALRRLRDPAADGAGPPVGLRRRVPHSREGSRSSARQFEDAEARERSSGGSPSWAAAHGGRGLFNVQLLRRGAHAGPGVRRQPAAGDLCSALARRAASIRCSSLCTEAGLVGRRE